MLIFKESNLSKMQDDDVERIYKVENFIKNAIDSMVVVFPNMIVSKVDYYNMTDDGEISSSSLIDTYKRWDLSKTHTRDLGKSVYDKYIPLKKCYDNPNMNSIFYHSKNKNDDINFLMKLTIYSNAKNDNTKICINDIKTIRMVYQFYFLNIISNLIEVETLDTERKNIKSKFNYDKTKEELKFNNNGIIVKSPLTNSRIKIKNQKTAKRVDDNAKKANIDEDSDEKDGVNDTKDEDEDEDKSEYVSSLSQNINICTIIKTFIKILCAYKKKINHNYSSLIENITKYKNAEKKSITNILDEMDDEERKVDKEMRNNKLGKWDKGSGRIYSKERYNEERKNMLSMIEDDDFDAETIKLNKKDDDEDEFYEDGNPDEINRQIEEDELDMSQIGEDNDNYGEEQDRDYGDYE
jgi:hypothetical protein